MDSSTHGPEASDTSRGARSSTRWSTVLRAQQGDSPEAREALAKLCQVYWRPVYAVIRHAGNPAQEAQDLTQEFFAELLRRDSLRSVARQKGRFRAFLFTSVRHFLANQHERARALKRGGACSFISLDDGSAESFYRQEPSHTLTPEKLYERRWATTLLAEVSNRLKAEYAVVGQAELFEALQDRLTEGRGSASYAKVGARLGMTEAAVKTAAFRLRRRFGELLREEVGHIVASPAEVEDELRHLSLALSAPGK